MVAQSLHILTQGPPYMEVFPSFFPESPHFSIDFPTNPANLTNSITDWGKGMTFAFDFLQSHVAISTNFARIDKILVPINQGKSILFEYHHLLAAYPLHSLRFFTKSTLLTIWKSTGNITGRCVQMQAFHWLPSLHVWRPSQCEITSSLHIWNAVLTYIQLFEDIFK